MKITSLRGQAKHMWLSMPQYITAKGITRLKCNRFVCVLLSEWMYFVPYAYYFVVTRRTTLNVNLVALQRIQQTKKNERVSGAFDNSRSTASFCRATSPCPLFTRHLLPRHACCCGTRSVYTFESTSLLLQPHSQFVRGENEVNIPVHH